MEKFLTKDNREVLIKRLVPKDFDKVQEYIDIFCEQTIFTNQYKGQPKRDKEDSVKKYLDDNNLFLGVFYLDKIVGLSSIRIERPNHPWSKNCSFGIGMLSDFHKQGIGLKLMILLEEWARAKGMHRIEGCVRTLNTGAINLYLKRGFLIEGYKRQVALIDGKWHDEYIIAKVLD